MRIDDFIRAVEDEPERAVTRVVRAPAAQTLEAASRPGGMSLRDFLSEPMKVESRRVRFGHVLGPPASREAVEGWHGRRASRHVPADLLALVERVNGIHLWANLETGRSYAGMAPIEEWDLARVKMYGARSDEALLDDRYVALTYHQDGGSFVVLDVALGVYFLMDAAGPDESTPIGKNAEDLLEWLWRSRMPPRDE